MSDYVDEKVNGPGIALLVVGVLALIGNLLGVIYQLVMSAGSVIAAISEGYPADWWIAFLTGTGWQVVMSIIGFFVAFIVIFAGTRLRGKRSPGLVYAGAILASLPCCIGLPCCCIGLPVGIWVIVTMQDEQVKAAFTE